MDKKLRYKTDSDKPVIVNNIEKRGFQRTTEGIYFLLEELLSIFTFSDDWHVYFANVGNVKALFNPENGYRLQDYQ
jgi:hypothetical protein